jgi:hypothetical protein
MLYFTDILPHEILFIFYVFHLNNYDFKQNSQHIKLYSKLKSHYFPILQPGHFRAYSTENDPFDAKS